MSSDQGYVWTYDNMIEDEPFREETVMSDPALEAQMAADREAEAAQRRAMQEATDAAIAAARKALEDAGGA